MDSNVSVVYSLLSHDVDISIYEIVSKTNMSRRTVNRVIKSLKEKGYISKVGGTRSKWKILK
ncbi:MAG TPA: hypothetical protein DDZ89_00675 [Clostridiales bacterium]|nr:hypothetical protein [Clostridiales bacterium]